jgi:hypothetical protein
VARQRKGVMTGIMHPVHSRLIERVQGHGNVCRLARTRANGRLQQETVRRGRMVAPNPGCGGASASDALGCFSMGGTAPARLSRALSSAWNRFAFPTRPVLL